MNDGSEWNVGRLWTMRKNCNICGKRRKSACNPQRICGSCWRTVYTRREII